MAEAQSQRNFLNEATSSNLPIIYTDGAATHTVYLARVRFSAPWHGAAGIEETAELTFVEAESEEWGSPTGWRDKLRFLHEAQNDVVPIMFCSTEGTWHRMFLTKIAMQTPYKGPCGPEPVVQLTMIGLWRGVSLIGEYSVSEYDRALYGENE